MPFYVVCFFFFLSFSELGCNLKEQPNWRYCFDLFKMKLLHVLLGLATLFLAFITLKFLHFLEIATMWSGDDSFVGLDPSSVEGRSEMSFLDDGRDEFLLKEDY